MVGHKERAQAFLQLAATGKIQEAYAEYVLPEFIHHNQYFKGDRESLMMAMEQAHKSSPNKKFEVRQIFEDGDFVITHSQVSRAEETALQIAVVHIFKFKKNKIAELWDLGQQISKDSPNQNGVF